MKRFAKIILISLIVLAAVVSPVGLGVAHASLFEDLVVLIGGGMVEGVSYIIAMVVKFLVYEPSVWILRAAAFVFDTVVPMSLGLKVGGTANMFQSTFITKGWEALRDIANMAFIFAMLYIALATILQIGAGKNTKALLVNIITIALFVNFSLFLAQMVIDGANLLAIEFYKVLAANEHGLAAIFLQGFSPQQLVNTKSFEDWITIYGQSNAVLLSVYLFGGTIQLIAAYMIFWASFLFIGRIVILWILMILSPLAFVAYIIPGTQAKFHEWWDTLLKQAFVAPIFLFFFFIFALFIGGGLPEFLSEAAKSTGSSPLVEIILKIVLGFSLVVAFLIAALKMTKKIGGEAAAMATKASGMAIGFVAGGVGGAVLGAGGGGRVAQLASMIPGVGGVVGKTLLGAGEKAGRVAGAPLRVPSRMVGERVREGVLGVGRGVVEKGAEGLAKRAPSFLAPALGGIGARMRAGTKAEVEKYEKQYGNFSPEALRASYRAATQEGRVAIIRLLGAKNAIKPTEAGPITRDNIRETLDTAKRRGYDTDKEVDSKYLSQYARTPEEKKRAARTMNVEAFKEIGKVKREVFNAKGEKEELPSDFFDDKEVFDAAIENMTAAHFRMLADPEVRSDFSKKFIENLKKAMGEKGVAIKAKLAAEGKSTEKIAIEDYFAYIKNPRGLAATKDPSIRGLLDSSGIPYKTKGGKRAQAEEGGYEGGEEDEESSSAEANKRRATEEARKAKMTEDIFGKPAVPPTTPST